MSYQPVDFQKEIALNGLIHQWYPNVKAELTLMSTAVKADLTTHDATIEKALGDSGPPWTVNLATATT